MSSSRLSDLSWAELREQASRIGRRWRSEESPTVQAETVTLETLSWAELRDRARRIGRRSPVVVQSKSCPTVEGLTAMSLVRAAAEERDPEPRSVVEAKELQLLAKPLVKAGALLHTELKEEAATLETTNKSVQEEGEADVVPEVGKKFDVAIWVHVTKLDFEGIPRPVEKMGCGLWKSIKVEGVQNSLLITIERKMSIGGYMDSFTNIHSSPLFCIDLGGGCFKLIVAGESLAAGEGKIGDIRVLKEDGEYDAELKRRNANLLVPFLDEWNSISENESAGNVDGGVLNQLPLEMEGDLEVKDTTATTPAGSIASFPSNETSLVRKMSTSGWTKMPNPIHEEDTPELPLFVYANRGTTTFSLGRGFVELNGDDVKGAADLSKSERNNRRILLPIYGWKIREKKMHVCTVGWTSKIDGGGGFIIDERQSKYPIKSPGALWKLLSLSRKGRGCLTPNVDLAGRREEGIMVFVKKLQTVDENGKLKLEAVLGDLNVETALVGGYVKHDSKLFYEMAMILMNGVGQRMDEVDYLESTAMGQIVHAYELSLVEYVTWGGKRGKIIIPLEMSTGGK